MAFAVEWDDTQGQSIIPPIAILQGGYPLEFIIPSERPEVEGRCGRYGAVSVCYGVGVDDAWEYHGIYQEERYE